MSRIVNRQSTIVNSMIHVAVLLKQYLDLVLSGRKTVECRLTRQARDPYERIEAGERIYFKQSSGPYGATAVVDHVIFEEGLTPKRVQEIRRDYNDEICGEPAFWNAKRQSSFCSLVWLKDVQAIDNGPKIRPLQGVAWLCLEEEPAWRRVETDQSKTLAKSLARSFSIEVTTGNIRNNSLYVTKVIDQFPEWSRGGKNKKAAAKSLTLMLHDGPTVQTDIVAPRNMLRTRVWGSWFRKHGVKPGDRVVFTPMDEASYFVGLAGARASRGPGT
jgi:ASC-1-like (ASCH) protein